MSKRPINTMHIFVAPMLLASSIGLTAPAYAQEDGVVVDADVDLGEYEQDEEVASDSDEIFANIFKDAFPANDEPIAPERLELGEQVALKILPPGSYRRIMGDTFNQLLEPMLGSLNHLPMAEIAVFSGVSADQIGINDTVTMAEITAIIDPHFEERQKILVKVMLDMMVDVTDEFEPTIRAGLAKAYARRFTANELAEMNAFFSTETGSKFASESMSIYTSQDVLAASAELVPAMFERMATMSEIVIKETAHLPPIRSRKDLSDAEREKLYDLLDVDITDSDADADSEQTPEEEY